MNDSQKKYTIYWLVSVCILIFIMVLVGGITRLTHSGLSMVDWKPILGTIPPIGEQAWLETFEQYKLFPEYQKVNFGMTLSEFKTIFFWEYLHRILGRIIGMAYAIPFLIFGIKKYYNAAWVKKLLVGLVLIGLQGLMGWYMVMSGLESRPSVSHYRLAAHLTFAFIIAGYILWIILDLIRNKSSHSPAPWFKYTVFITSGIILQIIYGAFTAGLKAGFDYNTFPLMRGEIIPSGAFSFIPFLTNFYENEIMVQFIHRTIAWSLLISITVFFYMAKKMVLSPEQKKANHMLIATLGIQFLLGVFTLIYVVPVALGVLHQGVAFILFLTAIYVNHTYSKV
ncbi:MAG: COX15/CtaA family protein [Leptospirales bacterium]